MASKVLAPLVALSLLAGSSVAAAQVSQSAPAAAPARAGAPQGDSQLRGTTGWIIGAIALALVVWGVLELLDDETATPASA